MQKVQANQTSQLADLAGRGPRGNPHLSLLRIHKLGPPRPKQSLIEFGFKISQQKKSCSVGNKTRIADHNK